MFGDSGKVETIFGVVEWHKFNEDISQLKLGGSVIAVKVNEKIYKVGDKLKVSLNGEDQEVIIVDFQDILTAEENRFIVVQDYSPVVTYINIGNILLTY